MNSLGNKNFFHSPRQGRGIVEGIYKIFWYWLNFRFILIYDNSNININNHIITIYYKKSWH